MQTWAWLRVYSWFSLEKLKWFLLWVTKLFKPDVQKLVVRKLNLTNYWENCLSHELNWFDSWGKLLESWIIFWQSELIWFKWSLVIPKSTDKQYDVLLSSCGLHLTSNFGLAIQGHHAYSWLWCLMPGYIGDFALQWSVISYDALKRNTMVPKLCP